MKTIFTFVFIFVSSTLFGQLVNVENQRKTQKEGWQGNISLAFNFTQNTKQIMQGANSIGVQYSKGASTYLFLNDVSFMKVDNDEALLNSGFQHLRYNYIFRDSSFLTLETFAQYQYNQVKLLNWRFISGIGPRFRLVDSDKFRIYLAPLIMYESESYDDDSNSEPKVVKGDVILTIGMKINELMSLNLVTYYQPELKNFSEYRMSNNTNLNIKIFKNLQLAISYDLSYDSSPPIKDGQSINDLFYGVRNTLTYSF